MHADRNSRPPGRGWVWNDRLSRWVWKSYPELRAEASDDGSLRYLGWDYAARAGKGEWYELPDFERTDWIFQYLPGGPGWAPRALTREQCKAAMREDFANGFYLRSWQVDDRHGNPLWLGFMFGLSTGRVLRMYEYQYAAGEEPSGNPAK